STLAAVSHELNNMVQGVVVFTDGRSTEGSAQAFADLAQRTRSAHIPLFVVAVGEERPQVKVRIEGVRLPRQVQPEDKFRAVAEAAGVKLTEGDYAHKKWELGETKDGELKVRAVIPRHKLEIFPAKQHVSEVQELVVLKRPMRVLLFASAPMRDYQFLRTLLV